MFPRIHSTIALSALVVATAFSANPTRITFQPESRLWIEGSANVRGYKCNATETRGTIATAPGHTALDVQDLERAVTGVELTIPVAALDCGNGTMDDHLRKALKGAEHPEIRYRLSSYEVGAAADGGATLTMQGTLSIAGKETAITMSAVATPDAGGGLRVTGSHELRMTAYGVRPPSLMLGTMRVHDPVTVRFDMLLK
jgi:polyisoprenoid-binding protein YceI